MHHLVWILVCIALPGLCYFIYWLGATRDIRHTRGCSICLGERDCHFCGESGPRRACQHTNIYYTRDNPDDPDFAVCRDCGEKRQCIVLHGDPFAK